MAKAKGQSSKQRQGTSDTPEPKQNSLLQSDITLIAPGETPQKLDSARHTARPRNNRREQPQDLDIDSAVIANLPQMNFSLLLAILLREKGGRVTLTKSDLDAADDRHLNICFALSLDNKALEVFVVSRQSGIIRSPEETAWAQTSALPAPQVGAAQTILQPSSFYSPPPAPPVDQVAEQRREAEKIVAEWQRNLYPAAGGDGARPLPGQQTESPESNRIVEMTPANQSPSPEKVFPFEVGKSPQDARQVNLSEIQSRLLTKDHEIAEQEAAAAARVERSV